MISWKNLDTLEAYKELAEDKHRVSVKEALTGEAGGERMKKYNVPASRVIVSPPSGSI